jgi:CTP:molybdopterin cytidylyltransferase MocA
MGTPKALLRDSRGRTFLAALVDVLRAGGCDSVLVVVGCHAAQIAAALPEGALLVRNPAWEQGQLSSAQAGLRAALALNPRRVVLHLIDQPLARASDVVRVLKALNRRDLAVAVHRGEPGHPVALSASAAARVAAAGGGSLREVLDRVARSRVLVAGCSAGCVRGANTPGELDRLLARARTRA